MILRSRAFTLIEILVVIAIIAVIAALLFPVFATVKANAKQTQCLAQMKQISIAVALYVADSDNTYPALNSAFVNADNPLPARTRLFSWILGADPYVKSADVYRCPTAKNTQRIFPFVVNSREIDVPERHTGLNKFVSPDAEGAGYQGPVSESAVGQAALLPLIADSVYVNFISPDYIILANYDSPVLNIDSAAFESDPALATMRTNPSFARHNGGSSVVFADSHAKWRSQGSMGLDLTRSSYTFTQSFLLPVEIKDDRIDR